jgi:hypothetical protein
MTDHELKEIQRKEDLDKRERAIRSEVSGLAARVAALEKKAIVVPAKR